MTAPDREAVRSIEFGGHVIEFDDRVLEPRPWTFLQSRWAAELASEAAPGPILELCSGAGQIGLLAAVLAGRDLVQVDVDPVACEWARRNAARAGWAERVEIRCAPAREAVGPDERFPVVLADPPYVPSDQIDRFPDDPVLAIDGGADGLDLVRECLEAAAVALAPGGSVLLQVWGARQAEAIPDLPGGLAVVDVREHDEIRAVAHLRRVNHEAPGYSTGHVAN